MNAVSDLVVAALLISLRIAPTFAFAPPFTLLRTPASVRLILALSLALWLSAVRPSQPPTHDALAGVIAGELGIGIAFALALQIVFAALMAVGRALDIQVGFGLAQIADPTLRTQMPLVGALFSYGAAAVFFSTGASSDLVAIFARSLDETPLGGPYAINIEMIVSHLYSSFILAAGLAGAAFLTIFLVDISIALMSRTLPQMNVLVLGFQVKVIALLLTLPVVFAFSGALFLRLVRLALDAMAGFI